MVPFLAKFWPILAETLAILWVFLDLEPNERGKEKEEEEEDNEEKGKSKNEEINCHSR